MIAVLVVVLGRLIARVSEKSLRGLLIVLVFCFKFVRKLVAPMFFFVEAFDEQCAPVFVCRLA